MNISTVKIPYINDSMQYTMLYQITDDVSIIIVFKNMFRSDDVIVDIYRDNVSNNSKIISGRKLTTDSLVSLPNNDVDFTYYINCFDLDGVNQSVKKYNAHKFYLQFTSYATGEIEKDSE